jgi:hypothetical protein
MIVGAAAARQDVGSARDTSEAVRMGRLGIESPSDPWYKNAVIYCVDVKAFQDSNGDGIGDFPGLTSRVDYLVQR